MLATVLCPLTTITSPVWCEPAFSNSRFTHVDHWLVIGLQTTRGPMTVSFPDHVCFYYMMITLFPSDLSLYLCFCQCVFLVVVSCGDWWSILSLSLTFLKGSLHYLFVSPFLSICHYLRICGSLLVRLFVCLAFCMFNLSVCTRVYSPLSVPVLFPPSLSHTHTHTAASEENTTKGVGY